MTNEEAIHIIEKDIQIDVRSCTNEEVHAFITALNMAIAALREQESAENAHCNSCKKCNSWIPVTERLPEPFVSVLVYMPDERPLPTVHEGFLAREGMWYANHFNREPMEITHWMSLPETPEDET